MVPHHRLGCLLFHHRPHNANHIADLRPPVNEISAEDRLPPGMPKAASGFLVAHLFKQLHEFVGVAVNVANDVVNRELLSGILPVGQ